MTAMATLRSDRFAHFRRQHPAYDAALTWLTARNPVLALAAAALFAHYGERLGRRADELLAFLGAASPDYLARFDRRASALMALQQRFLAAPSPAALCDGGGAAPSREDYDVALLASIVFTRHRFEIIEQLEAFYRYVARPALTVACIGIGTGYELMLARRGLGAVTLEGYDTDARARDGARRLLRFFDAAPGVTLAAEFPLHAPPAELAGRYDVVVMCELLEHLAQPDEALASVRAVLKPGGLAFVTMAVNLAQEDHIYWYPDVASCRAQIDGAGLARQHEWWAPATRASASHASDGDGRLAVGNYIAVVRPW
jgi:SAM-dependent methyltransferase